MMTKVCPRQMSKIVPDRNRKAMNNIASDFPVTVDLSAIIAGSSQHLSKCALVQSKEWMEDFKKSASRCRYYVCSENPRSYGQVRQILS